MKLHLPNSLRKAVLSCMVACAGLTTTLFTGAVTGGIVAFALSTQQAQATDYNVTTSNDAILGSATSRDNIVFDLDGSLYSTYAGVTQVQALICINKLNITSGVDGYVYLFQRKIYGSGDFNFTGVDGGDGLEFQFAGDMTEYTGNMTIAADKKGTFWFRNSCSTGTGSITALNADSVVKIGSSKIYNSSITAGNIVIDANATFKGDITLKATNGITNKGNDTWFQGNVTLASVINNEGGITFFKDIILDSSMKPTAITPVTNGFAEVSYQIITGSDNITLDDGVQIKTSAGKVLYTQSGFSQFTGTISGTEGTVYYIVEAGSTVKTSAWDAATGYHITGAGSVLEIDDSLAQLKDDVTVEVGSGNRVEILFRKGGATALSRLHCVSGKLDFTLDDNAAYSITAANEINGNVTVKSGATLTVSGSEALAEVGTLVLQGSEGSVATAKLSDATTVHNDMALQGNALVTDKSLYFGSNYSTVYAEGVNNTIKSEISGDKVLMFEVEEAGELKLTGAVNHWATGTDIFYKLGDGSLVLEGKEINIAGQVAVYGGAFNLNAAANLAGGAAIGGGSVINVNNGAVVDVTELKLDGGVFNVGATSAANVSSLIGKGSIAVTDGGKLVLTTVNSKDAISIAGTAMAGAGFLKTGAGELTLDVLQIDNVFNMNGHSGLNASVYDIAETATLVYGNSGDVLSIGAVTGNITLDVTNVVAELDTEQGIDTGITLGSGQSLDDLKSLLTVQGINSFKLNEQDGRVWMQMVVELSEAWDPNWGVKGLAAAPDAENIADMTIEKGNVSLQLAPTAITDGGTADTFIAGGIVRESTATALNQTGHSWVQMTGGTAFAVVGGNVNIGSNDEGCASFKGDTHVQVHGGSVDYIVGGNMRDYARPGFEGDTYVSVYQGATVNESVVGGSTIYYSQPVVVNGSTHVFVYTVLTDADATRGYVVGGNFHEKVSANQSGMKLSVTGSTNVMVDLSDYKLGDGAATDFTKHIVGGHYMSDYRYSGSINDTAYVTIVGKQGVTISGNVVGGIWTDSLNYAALPNTEVSISGNSVYTGRVVAGNLHGSTAGSSEVAGTAKMTINGGTFENYVVGGSSLAEAKDSNGGGALVNAVDLTINAGDFNVMVVGGNLVAADEDTGSPELASSVVVNKVTMSLNGVNTLIGSVCGGTLVDGRSLFNAGQVGEVTINVDGATVDTLYGGSYMHTESGGCKIEQGDITVNLTSGKLAGALYAAGGADTADAMTTASTTVNIGKDFDFSETSAISGGYYRGGAAAAAELDADFVVTGNSTLSFAAGNTYTNTEQLKAVDFNRADVGEGAEAIVASVENTVGSFTKSGAGVFHINSALAVDTIVLEAGKLNVGGVTSAKGLTVQATPGATMAVNGDLTMAAIKVDMEGWDGATPILDIAGKLSGFGADNALAVELTNYDKVAAGSYVLAEMGSAASDIQLQYEAFEGAPDGMIYELVMNGTSLVFNYRALSEWTWEGSAKGESAVWSNDGADGWKYDGVDTPSGQDVYFTAAGATPEAGNGVVTVSGTVTPGNIEMIGGEYTFVAAENGGDIQLAQGGALNIGSSVTLNMAMDNAELGGTTNLQGILVLQSADAMGNSALKFNGGTLVYDSVGEGDAKTHINTDLSKQASLAEGYSGAVKIEVTDADNTVTWNKATWDGANSGVTAIFTNGIEKSGDGAFTVAWEYGSSSELHTGDIVVKAGTLNLAGKIKGGPNLTFKGAMDVADGSSLNIHLQNAKYSSGIAATFSGAITGKGCVTFGKAGAADGRYAITGDNSAFAGTLALVGDGYAGAYNFAAFQNGNSFGGADTTVQINGRGFYFNDKVVTTTAAVEVIGASAGNLIGGGKDKLATFTGAWVGEEDAAISAENLPMTIALAGDLTRYKGTFTAAANNTWVLGGENVASAGSLDMKELKGAGTFKVQYGAETLLNTIVGGTAKLQQSGEGKLIIASENTTTGALVVDAGKEVQLGNAAVAGTWVGSELAGEGSFILTHGALQGLTTKAEGATLAVKTTKGEVSTFDIGAGGGTVVDLRDSDATLLDSIELVEGSTLLVDDALTVGGAGNTTLDMTLTTDNVTADNTGAAMIQGGDLTIAGTEGVKLNLSNADVLAAINNAAGEKLYVQITDGALSTADGVDINAVINPNLLGMGVRAQLTDEAMAGGYMIINGDISGVFFTDNQAGCSSATQDSVVMNDAALGIYAATVVNTGDTLTVGTNVTINNINSQSDGNVVINNGAEVTLNNKQLDTGVNGYDPMGADNTLRGDLTGESGTTINMQGAGGSLTVNGNLKADTLNVKEGTLTANGHADVATLTVASGSTFELGAGQNMQLGAAAVEGSLIGGKGSALSASGIVRVRDNGSLDGVALDMADGSRLILEEASSMASVTSLQGGSGSRISGNNSLLMVGKAADSSFGGTLEGSGELITEAGSNFTFDNATGAKGWNVSAYGNVVIDTTKGNKIALGQLSMKDDTALTLRFNSDRHQGNNFNIFGMTSLDLGSGQEGMPTAITLISTGVAQLEEGRYILGTLENGVSFDGMTFHAAEVELTDLTLQLLGEAFSRIDTEKSTLIAADGSLILNLVKSDDNVFEIEGAEKNVSTGAELLWKAHTPEDGDLADVYNAVNYMIADGDSEGAQKALAAVAGASTTTLGMAFAGDVDRQLRAIRNRTTTMGVNQSVYNENMPYVNAWVNAEGDYKSVDKDGYAPGYTLESWGGTIGVDVDVNPQLTLGLAVTAMYGDLTADGPEDVAEGDLDTTYLSAFVRYATRAWTHTFIATYGQLDATLERTVNHKYGSYTTEGDTDGSAFGLMYELTRTYALDEEGDACWQPIFNVAYRHTAVNAYTEEKSDAALSVGEQTLDTFTISAGARMQAIVGENLFERTSVLELRALAKVDLGDRASEADVALINGTGCGAVESAELGAFGVELGAGLYVPLGAESGTLFFDVSAELRSGYSNVNGTVGWRINF